MELLIHFVLGFIIALSGALIPGPLLVFVVSDTLKTGKKVTGVLAALGHCFVEVFIILTIVFGLSSVFVKGSFQQSIGLIGGIALVALGILNLVGLRKTMKVEGRNFGYGSFLGGLTFTLLNPTIYLWWATIGLAMLTTALRTTTILGVCLWVLGHWLADLTWFGLAGYSIFRGKSYIGKRTHRILISICGIILIALGTIFTYYSLQSLMT